MQIAGLLGRVTAVTHVKHLACHLIHAGNPQVYFTHHIINIGLANMAVSLTENTVRVWNPGRSIGSPGVMSGGCSSDG